MFHEGASNSPQSVRQDSVQTKPSYPLRSVQIGFARTCVLFYLQLTILCAEPPCCGRPCFVCWPGFVRFYQHHDVHHHFVSGATEKAEFLHWAQKRELIPSFLAGACFWAFIFGVLGRWTELWPRLGQARCVGVMAALPSLSPLLSTSSITLLCKVLHHQAPHNPAMNCLDVFREAWCNPPRRDPPFPVDHAEANILIP